MNDKPKIQVLMSTYNGAKFIDEQIDSIFLQEGVVVYLLIRDDGSQDDTWDHLLAAKSRYEKKICIERGMNLGYRKSFLSLFEKVNMEMDYFAFSDQDDVWLPKKLLRGANALANNCNAWLYTSALTITDQELKPIKMSCKESVKQSLGSFFVRTRLAGCTMIFKPDLAQIVRKLSHLNVDNEKMPDHDSLLCMLSMLFSKEIYIDNISCIFHRRHRGAETSGGRGLINRLYIEKKRILRRSGCYEYIAGILLNKIVTEAKGIVHDDNILLLNKIMNYNRSVPDFFALLTSKELSCGNLLLDLLIRIKIIMRVY